jgi:small subunit ribosomal protein S17
MEEAMVQEQGGGAAAGVSPAAAEPAANETRPGGRGRRQTKVGTVVSNKMAKTVVVAVSNTVVHPLYKRYGKRTSKFHAHDEENRCNVGDQVEIVSTRPLSKTKRWRVGRILRRAE